jgi:hypothetical protein
MILFLKLMLKNAIPAKFVLKNVRTTIFISIKMEYHGGAGTVYFVCIAR